MRIDLGPTLTGEPPGPRFEPEGELINWNNSYGHRCSLIHTE
jgi:hypothetical protein